MTAHSTASATPRRRLVVPLAIAVSASAIAASAALFALALALVAYRAVTTSWMRERRAAWAHSRKRRARRVRREQRLAREGVLIHELDSLTTIADATTAADQWMAERLELESILDAYVDVAIAVHRTKATQRRVDRHRLAQALANLPTTGSRPRELFQRRLAIWDCSDDRLASMEDQLAAIAEVVRLAGERAAMPSAALDDSMLEDRLALMAIDDLVGVELETVS